MKLGFIGIGNMGSNVLKGLIKGKVLLPEDVYIFSLNMSNIKKMKSEYKINICNSSKDLVQKVDIIILSIKPTVIPSVVKEIRESLTKKPTTLISIIPDISAKTLYNFINIDGLPIVRMLPNINVATCDSTTAYFRNEFVSNQSLKQIEDIFKPLGSLFYLDESKFPVFTAIGLCAPVYLFLFIEAISKGALKLGFNKDDAMEIISNMVSGSCKMLEKTEENPYNLIDKICSTTVVAIDGICTLEEFNFQKCLIKTIENSISQEDKLSCN